MAADDDTVVSPTSLDEDHAGLSVAYDVLEIANGSCVEGAREAAEYAMEMYQEGEKKEWIVIMKLAAFAYIVHTKEGSDRAWQLYQEVRAKNKNFKFLDLCREAHDLPERRRDGASSGTDKEDDRPPLARRFRSSTTEWAGRKARKASSEADGDDAGWSLVPVKQEETTLDEKKYWWQVRLGKAGKRKWGWVDDNVNCHLEAAFDAGATECWADRDEWTYHYDLLNLIQTSPGPAETKRELRRVTWVPVPDEESAAV